DDATTAQDSLGRLRSAAESDPILGPFAPEFSAALDDAMMDDGLSAGAIRQLNELVDMAEEQGLDVPGEVTDTESVEAFIAALPAPADGGDAAGPTTTAAGGESTETTVAGDAPATTAAGGATTETTAPGEGGGGGADLATEAQTVLDGGMDNDGDGLSNSGEQQLSQILSDADTATRPAEISSVTLDPTGPESSGQPDAEAANTFVSALESSATNLEVTDQNIERVLPPAEGGLAFLRQAAEEEPWNIDIQGVTDAAFDGNVEDADRAVGLFNGYCARCHTAGWSAGVPYSSEPGSGALGPALWHGREVVQFGEAPQGDEEDLLVDFLTNGSIVDEPYGLNGMGTGRMPAFGGLLSQADLEMLARYLRGGNLNGTGD
ncbi:MAG: hypothetical protein GEU71_18750, partial [Actinobacteria bacterium]|nr:hypothetical protein [Actinomycetota bacterium]